MRLLSLLAIFLLTACASPDSRLQSLMQERLALAHDIAWTKFSHNIPIYDPARETSILQIAMSQGRQYGLPNDSTRRHFAVQMEASRRIQWNWIHAWRKGHPKPTEAPRNLSSDLRPILDANQHLQLKALAQGAQPATFAQLAEDSERFLPKN